MRNIEAGELSGLLSARSELIVDLARVTDTPLSRFQQTKMIAAEGTLKQQEEPLLAKIRAKQVTMGNSWEDALLMARRLTEAFGQRAPAGARISTLWKELEVRDNRDFLEQLAIKKEKLAVPLEVLWAEAGYSQAEIEDMKRTEEWKSRMAQQSAMLDFASQSEEAEEG